MFDVNWCGVGGFWREGGAKNIVTHQTNHSLYVRKVPQLGVECRAHIYLVLAPWATRKDKVGLQKDTNSELQYIHLPLIFSLASLHLHVFSPTQLNQCLALPGKRSGGLLWYATMWTPPMSVGTGLDTHTFTCVVTHTDTHTNNNKQTKENTAQLEGHGYDSSHI